VARVVHFELAVDDPDRAAAFWRDAFGWEVRHFAEGPQDYRLVDTEGTVSGVMEANAAAR
jgi:predicted enzyme related to lactoylglutathione lyase